MWTKIKLTAQLTM